MGTEIRGASTPWFSFPLNPKQGCTQQCHWSSCHSPPVTVYNRSQALWGGHGLPVQCLRELVSLIPGKASLVWLLPVKLCRDADSVLHRWPSAASVGCSEHTQKYACWCTRQMHVPNGLILVRRTGQKEKPLYGDPTLPRGCRPRAHPVIRLWLKSSHPLA